MNVLHRKPWGNRRHLSALVYVEGGLEGSVGGD